MISLIGIAGPAGAGKDTVADRLVAKHGFSRYSLAGPIKAALNAAFGWSPEQWDDRAWKEARICRLGFSPRRAAQTLGTEWGRALNSNLWLLLAERFIERCKAMDSFDPIAHGIVIPDIRFEDEAAWVRKQGGVLWHITRGDCASIEAHASEAGVSVAPCDLTLHNSRDIDFLLGMVDVAVA